MPNQIEEKSNGEIPSQLDEKINNSEKINVYRNSELFNEDDFHKISKVFLL